MIKRIATAAVLIPVVLLLVLKAPLYVLAIVSGAVALLAIAEFLKLVTSYGVLPMGPATYAFGAIFFAYVIFASSNRTPEDATTAILYGIAVAAALAPFVFLTVAMRRDNLATGYPAAAASVFAFGYIAIPIALLVEIRQQPAGAIWTIYTLLAVWSGDIFAYFVGKSLGRHCMTPEISPKKTWEGAVGGVVLGAIVAVTVSLYGNRPPYYLMKAVAFGVTVSIAGMFGDLAESLLKREAQKKDASQAVPGFGGILDVVDSVLFAAPLSFAWLTTTRFSPLG
jgi:phosphatidate cytidylyltransferase